MAEENDNREIRYIVDLQRLATLPGDVFVITTDRALSSVQREAISSAWKTVMPDHKLIVLDAGLKLGVIGDEKEPT